MKNTSHNKPEIVYDSLADNYESWIEESAGLKIIYRAFHDAIDDNRGRLKGRVLDLGCGIGIFTRILSNVDGVTGVVGLDISRESVLHAKGKCNSRCSFLAGSAIELPFPDSSFDAVVALGDTISHIHNGYREAISEAARVLKPGGHLLFDVDNKWNLGLLSEPHELKAALQTVPSGHIRKWSFLDAFGDRCSLHFKTFRPSEIKGLLNGAGFTVLDFRGLIILPNIIPQRFHYNHPPEKPLSRAVVALSKLDRTIHRLPFFRGLGIGAMIAARKNG
ncbi:MAG: methyltransferase domain-containing protein [Deltaproteobacteria bacterium]|nr:methyltransferase domain-containing protein [Deltaproteobacteria bacterium]